DPTNGTSTPAMGYTQSAPAACGNEQCVTINGGTFIGAYCIITATNPGPPPASFDFSALVLQNASLKTGPWAPATTMVTARRALGMATVPVTPSARYLYAVGGDAGTEAGALDSVEAAPVDVFGKLGKWFT